MKLQSAVKKETVAVATGTGIGCLVLIALFLVFYLIFPESSVKFDYRVVLGALVGGAVAVANFFLMAVTVQNVVNVTNRDDALRMMRVSYRNRMLMRGIWIIIAIVAPCFNYAAGIIPLFIPGFVIKLRGIKMGGTGKNAASRLSPEQREMQPDRMPFYKNQFRRKHLCRSRLKDLCRQRLRRGQLIRNQLGSMKTAEQSE